LVKLTTESLKVILCTGGPCYMQSFYLRIHVYVIEKLPFFWNLSSNLQWSLVFLYANSLYASLFLESLSLAYNEVHLYIGTWTFAGHNLWLKFTKLFLFISDVCAVKNLIDKNVYAKKRQNLFFSYQWISIIIFINKIYFLCIWSFFYLFYQKYN